jgi:hypothetical protein
MGQHGHWVLRFHGGRWGGAFSSRPQHSPGWLLQLQRQQVRMFQIHAEGQPH